jgi:hypothetical protein
MDRNDIIDQLIADGIKTYTVYATAEWTNRVLDTKHFVPAEGIDLAADDMLFKAWEGEYQTDSALSGVPQTCIVYVVPTGADIDRTLLRFTRHVRTHTATRDSGPSPSFYIEPDDPTLGEARKILGPYTD